MQSVGYAALEVIPSMKGFEGKLAAGTSPAMAKVGTASGDKFGTAFSTKASGAIRSKFADTAKYIVGPLVGAFAVEKIGGLIKDSIGLASDLNESQNKVQQVFKSSAGEVFNFADHADRAFGQTIEQARDAASTFGLFGRAAGLNDQKTAKFSLRMTRLASDLASFHNTTPDQAIEAIGSAMRGETEPIRAYGVLLNQASLKAEALQMGLLKPVKDQAKIHSYQVAVINDQVAYNKAVADSGKGSLEAQTAQAKLGTAQDALRKATEGTVPQLTQQQQILAAQKLILDQTSTAQGDFQRTSHGLANQQRILSASWTDAKAKLGKGLLPVVTDMVTAINDHVLPAVNDFSDWFSKKGSPAIGNFVRDDLKPMGESALPAVKTATKDVLGVLKHLAPLAKDTFDAFNSLPSWAQKALVVGGAAAIVGKKSGAFSLGAKVLGGGSSTASRVLGAASQAKGLTPAEPLWVAVVNGGGAGGAIPTFTKGASAEAAAALSAPEIAAMAAIFTTGVVAQGVLTHKELSSFAKYGQQTTSPPGMYGHNTGYVDKPGQRHLVVNIDPKFSGGLTFDQYNAMVKAKAAPTASAFDAVKDHVARASREIDTLGRTASPVLADLTGKAGKYAGQFDKLPMQVRTEILTPGMVKSQSDIESLRRKYDLTPRQVSTLFRLTGIDEAKRQIAEVHAMAGRPLSATYNIELAGRPSPSAMDGVRRP